MRLVWQRASRASSTEAASYWYVQDRTSPTILSTLSCVNHQTPHRRDWRAQILDNDLTLIAVHTGGSWTDSAEALAAQVRPIFKALIACALAAGLDVGVATFSSQPELIAHILALAVPCDGIDRVVVRAGLRAVAGADPVAEVPDELRARFMAHGSGKQGHIASIVQRVEARDGKQLEPREVWLIDDDENNVVQARRNGMQAVQFDANKPDSIPGVVPERPAPG